MLRISHSIHYHPLFVYSSCTEQNRGSVYKKKRNEWQLLLFDFQITQASILLTWRVNKCKIQFPVKLTVLRKIKQTAPGHARHSEKSLGYMKGVGTLSKPQKEKKMSYPQKQLLVKPLVFKPSGLPPTIPTRPHSGCQSVPEERCSVCSSTEYLQFDYSVPFYSVLHLKVYMQKVMFLFAN